MSVFFSAVIRLAEQVSFRSRIPVCFVSMRNPNNINECNSIHDLCLVSLSKYQLNKKQCVALRQAGSMLESV